jgi:hypothetical protein
MIAIGTIHQTGKINTMLHPKRMTNLMLHNPRQHAHIKLLPLRPLLLLPRISLLKYLLKGSNASSIFDGAESKYPLLF